MNKELSKTEIKKRLMFVKGEDFYYLTYNMILMLDHLGCYYGSRKFKDYRKLAFLVEFVSDYNLANILGNREGLNPIDRDLLTRTYSNGMIRQNQLIRLLFTLEKHNLVVLEKEKTTGTVSVSLKKESLPEGFFNSELFQPETNNMVSLTKNIQKLSLLTLEKMLQRLFDNYGLTRWQTY